MTEDVGTCDRCGGTIGDTGWMKPTGRYDDELNAPIVEMFCEDCVLDGEVRPGWYCCVHCDEDCRFAPPGWHHSACDECPPREKDAP